MGVIKDGISFITLLVAFLGDYKLWVLFCLGLTSWFAYQSYFNKEVDDLKNWKKAFWIFFVITVSSNVYFWHQTKMELQESKNGNTSSVILR